MNLWSQIVPKLTAEYWEMVTSSVPDRAMDQTQGTIVLLSGSMLLPVLHSFFFLSH